VLKVLGTTRMNLSGYLVVVGMLEEALRFLSNKCGLAHTSFQISSSTSGSATSSSHLIP
jgi:hypothetical protein